MYLATIARILRFRRTMRWHIMRLVIATLALGLGVHSAITIARDVVEARNAQHDRAMQAAEAASSLARHTLAGGHHESLTPNLAGLIAHEGIEDVIVYDLRRDLSVSAMTGDISRTFRRLSIAETVKATGIAGSEYDVGSITAAVPIRAAEQGDPSVAAADIIGIVAVTMAHPSIMAVVFHEALPSLITFLFVLALLVPLAARTARHLARPMRRMSEMAHEISCGNFNAPAPPTHIHEVRLLACALKRMARKLMGHVNRIQELAYVDQVTSLPNRERFRHQCERLLADPSSAGGAILFVDLDRFKVVNDTLGHDAGDELLRIVADRLGAALRASDPLARIPREGHNPYYAAQHASDRDHNMVARIGGDEFTVLIHHTSRPEDIASIAQRLISVVSEPTTIKGRKVTIGASIGVAMFPSDGSDYATLLKHADLAMYAAKEAGRGDYAFYSQEMNERMHMRLNLEMEMREGLKRGEFEPYYQPKVETASGRPVGVEALVRWTHPVRGLLRPAEFIEIAEESGLVKEIGRVVLRKACADAAGWASHGHPMTVAVNISLLQFDDDDFIDMVLETLEETGLPAELLELEFPESSAMADPMGIAAMIAPLKSAGVRLAIDDFGTGYSSLSHLTTLPFDAFKIDGSFIARIGTDEDARMIVKTILGMAVSLEYQPVAEGVETEEQMAFLKQHGCTMAQGYLFAHPMPDEAVQEWLKDAFKGAPRNLQKRLAEEITG